MPEAFRGSWSVTIQMYLGILWAAILAPAWARRASRVTVPLASTKRAQNGSAAVLPPALEVEVEVEDGDGEGAP